MKTLMITLALILFLSTVGYSQNSNSGSQSTQAPADTSLIEENEIFTVCEQPPTFPGGQEGLNNFIRTNLHYQDITLNKRTDDKVFVTFIVTYAGTIKDITLLKGISPKADKEAIRLVQSMPKWIPARQSGRRVNFKYPLVIPFQLNDLK